MTDNPKVTDMNSQPSPNTDRAEDEPIHDKTTSGRDRYDGSLGQFLSSLLASTCRLGPAQAGAALRRQEGNRIDVLALHPELVDSDGPPAWLNRAAELARDSIQANRPTAAPWSEQEERHILSVPFRLAELPSVAAAFLIHARDEAALRAIRERLELGVSLLALSESRQALQKRELDLRRLHKAMEMLAAVNRHRRFGSTAMALCNEVAAQWQCDRASLGVLKGRYVQVKAMSHTESFSRKMQFVQDLESAMEECLDQDGEVIHPASEDSSYISRSSGEFSKRHGPLALASLPIRHGEKVWGVLTLQRPADRPAPYLGQAHGDPDLRGCYLPDLCEGQLPGRGLFRPGRDRKTGRAVQAAGHLGRRRMRHRLSGRTGEADSPPGRAQSHQARHGL
jgi:hypothetical protein